MMHENISDKAINLLVVEDDDVDLEKILRLLKKTLLKLTVVEAKSAAQTLALIDSQNFDCAILDYRLKDASGSDLIIKIQQHRNAPTPIIMVSGNSDERVIADAIRDGAFDYLPKRNLTSEHLTAALRSSLEWAESARLLKEDSIRFHQLAEGLPQLTWTCEPNGQCDFLNRRWCEYTGIAATEQLVYGWLQQVHPDDHEQLMKDWMNAVSMGDEMFSVFRIRRHDGEYRWFDARAVPQKNAQGEIIRWLGSNTDITDIELTRQALANSEELFHTAFDYAPLGMMMVNMDYTIIQANPALRHLLGYEQIPNAPLPGLLELIHLEDVEYTRFQLEKLHAEKLAFAQYETRLLADDGHSVPALISLAFINKFADNPSYLFQIYDLSERKRYESQLIKLAHFDPLTGLGNRAKLHEEIEFLIQKSRRSSAPFGVLFGDLDHFKHINDSLGHEAGDLLLKTVAHRMQRALRHEDSICRLGGDEFVVLVQDVTKFEAVVTVAEKLIAKISKPIRLDQHKVHVGMSFGIALYPTDGDDAKTLLRNADSALYDAKAKGRGGCQLYRKELTEYVHSRLRMDNDLRNAVSAKEFELYYQPVFDLQTDKIAFVEALLRWNHPKHGLITPDEFIPYAQESGLIVPIGEWVIKQACAQAADWNSAGYPIPVSINLSARQFEQNNLFALFSQALTESHLPVGKVIIEITEQMFLENTENNLKQISELKTIGVSLALDDFGIGYSSLSYIVRFAPQYLKIDRSFVSRIGEAREHDEMVSAIIGLRKIIPMEIVGEGIEDNTQRDFLASRNCDLGQGYMLSRPLPHDQFLALLRSHKS